MEKLKMHSPNLVEQNIEQLATLFPNCVTESKGADGKLKQAIDFDLLKQELSRHIVEGPQERYHLNWPGKREALLTANAPIAKTLRPCREESVNFDTTQNLFIEGDNLDALKLLQETYLGKVKMIYIDPPYNTGNDFIYNDDFAENVDSYIERSNQKDVQGNRLVTNTESNGRFHSDWLSNFYPRLKLSRRILTDDGVVFISIDDSEAANAKKLCDEVFGEDCFVCQFIWKARVSEDTRSKNGASIDHEYILCYSKTDLFKLRGVDKDLNKFNNPDDDPRGPWRSADMTGLATVDKRPNLHYDLVDPETKINYGCPPKGWRFEFSSMMKRIAERRILWPDNGTGRPRQKLFMNEMNSLYKSMTSIITSCSTSDGTKEVNNLIGTGVFDFPKPMELIRMLVEQSTDKDSIVLDFYAGSATTAHAVMKQNSLDGGRRKYILIQLPVVLDVGSAAHANGFNDIASVSKQRIKNASNELIQKNSATSNIDYGFRALKVDTSNMAEVYYNPDAIMQSDLFAQVENVKEDRTEEDLLFQVMLDWGVDLTLPIRRETIADKMVFFVDAQPDNSQGALVACFDKTGGVNEVFIKQLANFSPLRLVFRDAGFVSDAAKINVEQLLKQLSPTTDVKTI